MVEVPDPWFAALTMPDDSTQTLADVISALRDNNLQRQAAFVEWLADSWYEAHVSSQSHRVNAESLRTAALEAGLRAVVARFDDDEAKTLETTATSKERGP